MSGIEQRGQLYLGREYDLKTGTVTKRPVLYPARHLTTHAILLGMTGSGKTGLGIILLEEALLQGIPVLAVDPKGDLTNIFLTFPELTPEDFEPWVDTEWAKREGLATKEAAAQAAQLWQEGLAKWGITGERISRLRHSANLALFTPGSGAATPVNVLQRFEAPALDWETYAEVLRERIQGLVTAILGLAGRESDPLQSPEHVLLSHIIEHAWREGQPLDLPGLIHLIQEPPIHQIGVFDLESFLPQKERLALARALNNVFAAPGFEKWREGVPLEIGDLLRTPEGRPQASIFYLPHLDDTERDFFVTLLLEATRDWMAGQSGTSDLRAVLYFDEVFGFFPPHPANPPTKQPLMALIKQGRAAGLGVILSTQNPADLDYKGLTNAGTWAIGTLRTERDKDRVLEGLEGATSAAGVGFARATLDRALGTLKPRIFLLHDVHADAPLFFRTRWAMSYLRGPLTRAQVQQLAGTEMRHPEPKAERRAAPEVAAPSLPEAAVASTPPALPAGVAQVFLPAAVSVEWALHSHEERTGAALLAESRRLVYTPWLLALGTVYLNDERKGVHHQETVARLLEPEAPPAPLDWEGGDTAVSADDLSHKPVGKGAFLPPAPHLAKAAGYTRWSKSFAEHLYRNIRLPIWHNPALKLYGKVGETRRDFRVRCENEVRSRRDAEAEKARAAIDKKMTRLQGRLRREKRELAGDQTELDARKREELLGYGESALNLLTGRRPSYMISRASRKRRMTKQAEADVEESMETIEDLEAQLEDLSAEWEEQAEEISARWAAVLEEIAQVEIAPRRTDVVVDFCGLAWVPVWEVTTKDGKRLTLPAFEPKAAGQ